MVLSHFIEAMCKFIDFAGDEWGFVAASVFVNGQV